MQKTRTVYRLTESAVMLAVAAVLSVVKLVDMPYGGSVTAFSMLPILLIAYRYGTKWGLLTGATYGLIQLLLGMDNLSYATSFGAAVAIILFDYLLAFVVLGLGGIFRRAVPSQGGALCLAVLVTGVLRYVCHTVSGCTVWAGLSVPTGEAVLYSLSYNATYMIPEIVILVFGAYYLSRVLDFSTPTVSRAAAQKKNAPAATVFAVLAQTALLTIAVYDIIRIAPKLQYADGTLFLAGLASVHPAEWVSLGCVLLYALFSVLSLSLSRRDKEV